MSLLSSIPASTIKIQKLSLSPIFLLISNLINKLRLQQFLGTTTTDTKKLLKSDANLAYK
jgi:hypothetical protein